MRHPAGMSVRTTAAAPEPAVGILVKTKAASNRIVVRQVGAPSQSYGLVCFQAIQDRYFVSMKPGVFSRHQESMQARGGVFSTHPGRQLCQVRDNPFDIGMPVTTHVSEMEALSG